MYKIEKYPEADRNFETRVKFIRELFTNKYPKSQIIAHCIQHKLDRSYDAYIKEIHRSLWQLQGRDPMAVLKKIDG